MHPSATKFLLVEDNVLDVEKISRGFKRLKFENQILHAKDGIDALEILRGTAAKPALTGPCVILLDLNMPRMSGHELLEEIRADRTLSHLPVVVLTTSNRPADVEAAYLKNVSGYLVKPMKTEHMYEALEALMGYWKRCELPHQIVGVLSTRH